MCLDLAKAGSLRFWKMEFLGNIYIFCRFRLGKGREQRNVAFFCFFGGNFVIFLVRLVFCSENLEKICLTYFFYQRYSQRMVCLDLAKAGYSDF